jgi:murein DD-endopeptidase MepM/ murein hydrolase activator NlpD
MKKEHILASLLLASSLIQYNTFAFAKASFSRETEESSPTKADTRDRLEQIEKRRQELHERASQVRQKERIALQQLKQIKNKLSATTGVLKASKHKLQKTENKINEVQQTLVQTKTNEADLTQQASQRLREIYEGQRLNFIEMLFQMNSIQSLLDKLYFQEKIAILDRKMLAEMRASEAALAQNKEQLGKQKNQLGDMVSSIAKQAIEIAKAKFDQEQIANRLKTQRAFYEEAEKQLANESHQLETQIVEMESKHHRGQHMMLGSGSFAVPLKAQITSPFGWRKHPIFGIRRFHTGIDLAGPNHSAIRAADSGNVLYTGWYGGYGKVVIISHGKGMATLYAHLCKISAESGTNIAKGDVIGYEGTTGFSTGPHLHFEVRVNGIPNNPVQYLR